jgi:hypothetical protein
MIVKATREGMLGDMTASGWRIDATRLFCALPSTKALRRSVLITNPANGKSTRAEVLDVGPWNVHDDAYVLGGLRPLAESGHKINLLGQMVQGITNGAGIDLGEAVWAALEMTNNGPVDWHFDDIELTAAA